MAEYTANYNLYKPNRVDAEAVDTTLSANFTTIDTEIKKRQDDISALNTEVDNFQQQIDTMILESGTSDTEVVQARGTFPLLYNRLDSVDVKIKGFVNIAQYGALNGDGATSDQTVIASAVADAKAKGYALNWGWDGKTYLTTDNIPDFHSVKHIGNAIIKRGTDLFYISPRGTQRNKLYTASSGASNTFDGLSSAQPIAQLQVAFNALANYGPVLPGYWEIIMTTGTYPNRAVLQDGLLSENPIEITGADVGGHPNVPTTIISEGTGIAAVGIKVSGGSKIKPKNIKFVGFNGSTSSGGIVASDRASVITDNCHYDQCFYGLSGQNSNIVGPNGIYDACGKLADGTGVGAGVRSLQANRHAIGIQGAGVRTGTAIFRNCRYGVWAQESSTGHVDWCTFEDNEDGFVGRVSGRGNLDGCSFKRNGRAVRLDGNGHAFLSGNIEWGTGADANTVNVTRGSGAQVTGTVFIEGVEVSRATTESIFEQAYKAQTIATTSNSVFHTANLLAPLWRNTPSSVALGKKVKFKVFGVLNGANSNKRIYVRLGTALLGVTFASTDSGEFVLEGDIYFTKANEQYMFMKANRHLGTSSKHSRVIGTNEMTANTALTFEAQVDNVADSVLIDMIEISWAG